MATAIGSGSDQNTAFQCDAYFVLTLTLIFGIYSNICGVVD